MLKTKNTQEIIKQYRNFAEDIDKYRENLECNQTKKEKIDELIEECEKGKVKQLQEMYKEYGQDIEIKDLPENLQVVLKGEWHDPGDVFLNNSI